MTQEVGRIREFSAAVGRADLDAVSGFLHPDVVWEHNIGAGTPEEGVYRGRESVIRLLGRITEGWRYQRPEPDDIRQVGEGVYVVTGAVHSKHLDTASEIVSPYRQRLEFRDGLLAKTRLITGTESENIASVRRFVEAFNRLDLDSIAADLHPDIELDEWPETPGARTYRGPDGIGQALDTWFESWEWMRIEIEDMEEVGDSVLVTLHQRAKGKGSAAEVELTSHNVYSFREGKVIRIQLFTEREPALKAAGLIPEHEEETR